MAFGSFFAGAASPPAHPPPPGPPPLTSLTDTVSFLASPVDFLTTRVRRYGPLFTTLLLGHGTTVAACHNAAAAVAGAPVAAAGAAYADLLGGAGGYPTPNSLTSDGQEHDAWVAAVYRAGCMRRVEGELAQGVTADAEAAVRAVLSNSGGDGGGGDVGGSDNDSVTVTIDAYRFAKAVSVALTRSQVLGVPVGATVAAKDGGVGAAVSAHFRGAIALPLVVRVGGLTSAAAAAADGRAWLEAYVARLVGRAAAAALVGRGTPLPPPTTSATAVSTDSAVHANITRPAATGMTAAAARDGGIGGDGHPRFVDAIIADAVADATVGAADALPRAQAHLLLLSSGVIPKALASALTSVLIETGRPGREALLADLVAEEDARRAAAASTAAATPTAPRAAGCNGVDDAKTPATCEGDTSSATAGTSPTPLLEAVITEALRLHPPLLGGCRVAPPAGAPPLVVAGHAVPAGGRLWYAIPHANRDPRVYERPAEFYPARWEQGVPPGEGRRATSGGWAGSCPLPPAARCGCGCADSAANGGRHDGGGGGGGGGHSASAANVAVATAASTAPRQSVTGCGEPAAVGTAASLSPPALPLTFGGSSRPCPGRALALSLLRAALRSLLATHTWAVLGDAEGGAGLRYMPVLRPRGEVTLRLCRRLKVGGVP
ncbi:hypothetical protein MMPV_001670 [Pyropia vietnamensis]